MRRFHEGLAVMHSVPWTPAVELASSLQGHLDHAVLDPGKQVNVSLAPLYPPERAADNVIAAVVLVPSVKDGPAEKILAMKVPVDRTHLPFSTRVALPETPVGDYTLEIRLTLADGTSPADLRTAFVKTLPIHIESLSSQAQRLRDRLAKVSQRDATSLPTARYVLERYEESDHGDASPLHYNFQGEFAAANAILDSLDALPADTGTSDPARAYLSKVDQTFSLTVSLFPLSTTEPSLRRWWLRSTVWAATRIRWLTDTAKRSNQKQSVVGVYRGVPERPGERFDVPWFGGTRCARCTG